MKIHEGDKIPDFNLTDSHGNIFHVREWIGKKVLVFYFYPKNFTPGCTKEACGFRDHYQNFTDLGAEVIGISSDSVESHQRFKDKYKLPFLLLSDPTEEIRKKFGVKGHVLGIVPGRETFVVDKKGIVRFKFNSLNASKHMDKALATVKNITHEN